MLPGIEPPIRGVESESAAIRVIQPASRDALDGSPGNRTADEKDLKPREIPSVIRTVDCRVQRAE